MEEENKNVAEPDAREKCEAERGEYLEGWKRAKADLINYKKDEERRFREFAKLANESLLDELLSVMDSFELGLKGVEKDSAGYRGMLIIKNQFEDIIKRYGLERVSSRPGEKFDPAFQEALSEVFSEHPEGTIAEEIRSGYSLNGKVLRPARVALSKGQKTEDK